VASPTGALLLSEVRQALADVLAPGTDDDFTVQADLVDAVEPPVLLLEWADPWLTPRTVGGMAGWFDAHLDVRCVAGRLEPGPGVETLEALVAHVLAKSAGDLRSWPVESTTSPLAFAFGGVTYLGARVSFVVPVAID
jgi:hypothetical protein